MKNRKLFIAKSLQMPKDKILVMSDFIVFCADSLPVKGKLSVKIVGNRDEHGIKTTAAYRIGENEICVYAKNRAMVDVLRSIAHEMTHMLQDHQGLIDGPVRDAGGFHEDHANAKAGELIKLYAKQPGRKIIYENIYRKIIL